MKNIKIDEVKTSCVDNIYEIGDLIKKKKKTLKYWFKSNYKQIISYFKRNPTPRDYRYPHLHILADVVFGNGGGLWTEYFAVLETHLRHHQDDPSELSPQEQHVLYNDLRKFERQLMAIKFLIESDLIDDYSSSSITTK